jgi:hypothetical protein
MADFVQQANVKRSVRTLTTKIADVATLNTLVQGVIDNQRIPVRGPRCSR